MPQRHFGLDNAPTKLMRGYYVAVCIYQLPPFIPDKNKHVVPGQTYKLPSQQFCIPSSQCGVQNTAEIVTS